MAPDQTMTDDEGVIKKLVLGFVAIATAVALAGWAYSAHMDRQMDSTVPSERLAATPIPDMTLVDQWNRDGNWLFKKREPEAARLYVAAGTVTATCERIDQFYENRGLAITPTARSDAPLDWCGRSVRTQQGRVSIWIEPVKSWAEIPDNLADEPHLMQVEYLAHRR